MRPQIVSGILGCVLLGSTLAVSAATLHVSTSGSDSNPCTADTPCRSIRQATGRMGGGDTVIVHGGTYTEGNIKLPSGSSGAPSVLQGAPGETVTLQPNSQSVDCLICLQTGQSYITIDGLVLDAGSPSGDRLSFAPVVNQDHDSPSGHHFTIQNCEVKNGRQQGLHIAGGNWLVKNNHVHHNGTDPQLHHGIYFSGHDSVLSGNTLDNNKCFGVQNYSSAGANTDNNTYTGNISTQNGCGIVIAQGSGHTFTNNLIYQDGTATRTPGVLTCCGPNSKVTNNTIVDNPLTGIAAYGGSTSNVEVRQNIVCDNSGGQINLPGAALSNNLTTCPAFVDADHGDFHVREGSDVGIQGAVGTGAGQGPPATTGVAAPAPSRVPAPRNLRIVTTP